MGTTIPKKSKAEPVQTKLVYTPFLVKATHLPHSGNNCYMISTLELLYSMPKIRQYIQSTSQINPRYLFHNKLRRLFYFMQKNQKNQMSKELLTLFDEIQEEESEIDFEQQQDIIIALNTIINQLKKEDEGIESFFALQYQSKCGCPQSLQFRSNYIQRREFCSECKQEITRAAYGTPAYLICIADDYHIHFEDTFDLLMESERESNGKKVKSPKEQIYSYSKLCQVIYQGNKTFGHYQTWVIQNLNQDQLQNYFSQPDSESLPRLCVYQVVS